MRTGELTVELTSVAEYVEAALGLVCHFQLALLVDALEGIGSIEFCIALSGDGTLTHDIKVGKRLSIIPELGIGFGTVEVHLVETADDGAVKLAVSVFEATLGDVEHGIYAVQQHLPVEIAFIGLTIRILDGVTLVISIDKGEGVGIFALGAGDGTVGMVGDGCLHIVEVGVLTVAVDLLDEAEYLGMLFGVLGVDEGSTGVNDASTTLAPVVAAVLVEQCEIFGRSVHLAPSHILYVGIHSADGVIVVPLGEFGVGTANDEDVLRIVVGVDGVRLHVVLAGKEGIVVGVDDLRGIVSSESGIFRVWFLVGTAHVEIDTRKHGLCSSLRCIARTLCILVMHELFCLLEVVDGLHVALVYGGAVGKLQVVEVVGGTVHDGHAEVLFRSLEVWTSEGTCEIEVHHAADVIAFAEFGVHLVALSFGNHLDDVRGLCHSLVAIVPEILQTIVVGGAAEGDELIEGVGRRTANHHVVAGIFAETVHGVAPVGKLCIGSVKESVERLFGIVLHLIGGKTAVGQTLDVARGKHGSGAERSSKGSKDIS